MRRSLKSIHLQVLLSFLAIIIFTLAVSTVFEYYTYVSELPGLFTEFRAGSIAANLSSTYTRDRGWENLTAELQRMNNLESLNTAEDAALRVIVRDVNGKTLYNSFLNITELGSSELLEGDSMPVTDYSTGEEVGWITVYIGRDYIDTKARVYIVKLLYSAAVKSLITAFVAFIVSLLFSRKITAPVIKLTEAVQSVSEDGSSGRIDLRSFGEIEKLSAAFNSMIDALKFQRESRKKLIADVSHEINTPLTAIRLEAGGLRDGLVSLDEAALHIMHEVDALKNIIYDLDWLAETDSGAYSLTLEETDLDELVSDEIKRWEYKASAVNISIKKISSAKIVPHVQADAVRISTVIGNLIANAVKYAPEGSDIRLCCSLKNGEAVVSVCDDGSAVPKGDREFIFERFYRADTHKSGRGLGLSIVKQIIGLHGGRVWLECGEQTGNCFFFTLPVLKK